MATRTMRAWGLALTALALAGAARAAPPPDPRLVDYTLQARNIEQDLKNAKSADERAQIADALERTLHQMGPFDANGNRIHPKAMWHDTALETLAAEVKRLESRSPTGVLSASAQEARLQTRRLASACLLNGWRRLEEDAAKYQADAFGQYLANNLKTLDGLFDALAQWCIKESNLEPDSSARALYETHLGRAREGIVKMRQAADRASEGAAADAEALGLYMEGLKAVREADLALTAAEADPGAPGPAEASSTEPAAAADDPPPMTDAEKQRVAQVRRTAAALEDEAWQEIRQRLEKYADAVANGFAVPSARPKAREFLDHLERAAALAQSLHEGKGAYPGYAEDRLKKLKAALEQMESPPQRAKGYSMLRGLWDSDRNRRVLADGPITPEAAGGVAYACYVVQNQMRNQADEAVAEQGRALSRATGKILSLFEQLPRWPPKNMKRELRELYMRQLPVFAQAVEKAGKRSAAKKDDSVPVMASAANAGRDLERLVRAQHVYDLVAEYLPSRAAPMYEQLATAAVELVLQQSGQARGTLDRLLQPFERLEDFKMPEARHQQAVKQVAGSAYAAARAFLNREITEGILGASGGDSRILSRALNSNHMFALLWQRAVVLTNRLDRFGLGNLAPASLPDAVWNPFIAKLDPVLRATLAAYPKLRQQNNEGPLRAMERWNDLYRCVAEAQRLTMDERREGESDADFLLRNLERTAVADPRAAAWAAWAVGYHATEGAGAWMAGFSETTDWHRAMIREQREHLPKVEIEPDQPPGP